MKIFKFLSLLFITTIVYCDEEAPVEETNVVEEEEQPEHLVDGFTAEQRSALEESSEKHEFQAEVNRLMDIIINSLYTNKDVFLRELISNAADALEKARFHSVQDETYLSSKPELEIKLEYDDEAKTLSVWDSGVGMTKTDLINNLGTVAKSGTTNFLEAMAEGNTDTNLIGQFGVGFYAAFLVADKITVTSKHNDEHSQHVWESSAGSSFSVSDDPRGDTLGRGTRVTLHLKEDAYDYLNSNKLEELTRKFSQFVQFPIKILTKKEVDDEEDTETDESKKKKKTVWEYEQVNTQKPIWLRSKEDIAQEEYTEFYKSISKDYMEPLAHVHFNAEGEIEFKSVLFLPKKAPFDQMDNYATKKSEIKLYVRRVLIADKFEDLLPKYLSFIRGVVDSDDLPLNVNREQLQQTKILSVISKKLVRKSLEMIKKLAQESAKKEEEEETTSEEDEEKKTEKKKEETPYEQFYKEFGKHLKMGCYDDDSNRAKIAKLLRFHTTKSTDDSISLEQYLENMPESQDSIYYMSGENLEVLLKSPSLQVFKKKGIEVLLLTDHLDEPCIQKLTEFDGKKFVSIQKADVKLEETEEEVKRFNKLKKMYKPLTDWWKNVLVQGHLATKIESVQLSKRLVDSPCVVVTSQFGYSAYQEKIMKSQAFGNKDQMAFMMGKKILEVNPNHPVIINLLEKVKSDDSDDSAKETAEVLYETAAMESGYDIEDPSILVKRMYRLMSAELGVDPDAPIQEVEVPDDEEEVDEDNAETVDDAADFNLDDEDISGENEEEEEAAPANEEL